MKSFLTFLGACFSLITLAQDLSVSSLVKFASTHELATDSETVFIRNFSNQPRTIDQVYYPTIYDTDVFTSINLIGETIAPNDSIAVKFYFAPDQNILYTQDILIGFDNGESIVVEMEGQGRFTNTYYLSTRNKEEQDLKDALKTKLAQGYNGLSYNAARDNMYAQLDNVGGDVECVYTGRVATFNSRAGANSNNFNCEHTYPQSFFNSASPMVSDIHHLFPTDGSANSVRSNNPFGVVNNPTWSVGGSKYGSSVFEPRDEHKGDCARAMMYFVTRYQDYQGFFAGQEAILRQWHDDYPPTQKSIDRNNGIAALQTSRNPFVDYPQIIKRITNLAGNSVAASNPQYVFDTREITISQTNPATNKAIVTKAVANTGNTTITLYEPTFSLGDHSIINFPASDSLTLTPGESFTLLIEVAPTTQATPSTELSFGLVNAQITSDFFTISWDPALSYESLKPQTSNLELEIFPNPSNGEFTLSHNEALFGLNVFNLQGSAISFDRESVGNTTQLKIYDKGIYLLEATTENGVSRSRVVVY